MLKYRQEVIPGIILYQHIIDVRPCVKGNFPEVFHSMIDSGILKGYSQIFTNQGTTYEGWITAKDEDIVEMP